MAISRRADSLDLGVTLAGEAGRRKRGGHLRRWVPLGIGILMAVAMIVVAAAAPLVAPLSPSAQYSDAVLKGPGAVERHRLGTDEFGRDILSRIIWGARVSLQVGLASVIWGFLIGVPLGILAGTRGGMVETGIMRCADMLMAFPTLLLALPSTASAVDIHADAAPIVAIVPRDDVQVIDTWHTAGLRGTEWWTERVNKSGGIPQSIRRCCRCRRSSARPGTSPHWS